VAYTQRVVAWGDEDLDGVDRKHVVHILFPEYLNKLVNMRGTEHALQVLEGGDLAQGNLQKTVRQGRPEDSETGKTRKE
jgi:hypothetical protein